MNETIRLMQDHVSVRHFTKDSIPKDELKAMIEAGRSASTWKNFQSYSIVVVQQQAMKDAIYDLMPQPAIQTCSHLLIFVGDLTRGKLASDLHKTPFYPEGEENLLISAVDTSLVAQNTLLAAESMGYGGVMIGLIREVSEPLSQLIDLPEYTYPIMCLAIGKPAKRNAVKPRLPHDQVVFEERYQVQNLTMIEAYDQVQTAYSNHRGNLWSERLCQQWQAPAHPGTNDRLKAAKLL